MYRGKKIIIQMQLSKCNYVSNQAFVAFFDAPAVGLVKIYE